MNNDEHHLWKKMVCLSWCALTSSIWNIGMVWKPFGMIVTSANGYTLCNFNMHPLKHPVLAPRTTTCAMPKQVSLSKLSHEIWIDIQSSTMNVSAILTSWNPGPSKYLDHRWGRCHCHGQSVKQRVPSTRLRNHLCSGGRSRSVGQRTGDSLMRVRQSFRYCESGIYIDILLRSA